MKPALLLLTMAFAGPPLVKPQDDQPVAVFIESARVATEKYKDRSVAIAEGYRQIGHDFPAMGEHWIRIGLVFDGTFDPSHPEILTYAVVSGKPQLLGVAYVLPLLQGESAPDWPVRKEAWHDHFRTVDDETVLPLHHTAGSAGDGPRMTMLHAWIWLSNPAGMFAADNWAIPYFRLGIQPPAQDGPDTAAKALSLASGGAEYFTASIEAAVPLTARERKKIAAAFARSRAAVDELLRGPSVAPPTRSEAENLSAVWTGLWNEINSSVSVKARPSLQRVPIR